VNVLALVLIPVMTLVPLDEVQTLADGFDVPMAVVVAVKGPVAGLVETAVAWAEALTVAWAETLPVAVVVEVPVAISVRLFESDPVSVAVSRPVFCPVPVLVKLPVSVDVGALACGASTALSWWPRPLLLHAPRSISKQHAARAAVRISNPRREIEMAIGSSLEDCRRTEGSVNRNVAGV
jgi:hypothetical protein